MTEYRVVSGELVIELIDAEDYRAAMQEFVETAVKAGQWRDMGQFVIAYASDGEQHPMRVAPAFYHAGLLSKDEAVSGLMRVGFSEYEADEAIEEKAGEDAWLVEPIMDEVADGQQ